RRHQHAQRDDTVTRPAFPQPQPLLHEMNESLGSHAQDWRAATLLAFTHQAEYFGCQVAEVLQKLLIAVAELNDPEGGTDPSFRHEVTEPARQRRGHLLWKA